MLIKKPLSIFILGLSGILLGGCSEDSEKVANTSEKATTPAAQVQAKQLAANEGHVLEALTSGGYTYVQVEQNGNKFWLAGSGAAITKGELISWGQAALMENFTSKTLNRTFDKIYFVSSFTGKATTPVHSGLNLSQPAPVSAPRDMGKVLSHTNSGGYTYIQAETPTGETWVAAPKLTVKDGDLVRWTGASKMTNFTSKTLNKTFPEILFVARAQVVDAKQAPATGANTSGASANQGEVIALEESGGYTYLQLNTQTGEKWLAVPSTTVSVGDTVSWNGGSAMHNFTSKTLNKTFKEILFAGGITVK